VVNAIRSELDAAGYCNRVEVVLDAADYGVPQRRNRWFLLASRDAGVRLRVPDPTTAGRPTTAGEALADLPLRPGSPGYGPARNRYVDLLRDFTFWRLSGTSGGLTRHVVPRLRASTVARYSLVPAGGRVHDVAAGLDPGTEERFRARGVLPRRPFEQRGRRLRAERPAPTVTSHCREELIHPRANRVLTVREVARLQSFPDAYAWAGPLAGDHGLETQTIYHQLGNAVPPLLAFAWGRAIRDVLA
jgi:DNA (cytosine-5)-methyltransferase 1